MRKFLSTLFVFLLLGASSGVALALEINQKTYDIYLGDVDGDGISDFYFAQKSSLIILHGEIVTPLLIKGTKNFVVFSKSGILLAPQSYTLADSALASKISTGVLRLATVGNDIYTVNAGVDQSTLLIRGINASAPALLITSSASRDLPAPADIRTYSPNTFVGVSNRAVSLQLRDTNGDGLVDLVLNSDIYLASTQGVFASAIPITNNAIDPVNDLMTEPVFFGALNGEFGTDGNGAFNYSVDITIPPGINHVQPKISIEYNSQTKSNGLLGVGWVLEGLSSIKRCNSDLIRDGAIKGIVGGVAYQYCLDGQRLVMVSTDGSEWRLENNNDIRVQKKSDYWVTTDKSGISKYFGYSAISTQKDNVSDVFAWYMDRVEDVNSNYYTVDYEQDGAGQNFRPKSINYTANSNASTNLNNKIEFGYADREDSVVKFEAGRRSAITQRLSSISVSANASLVRKYTLNYQQFGGTYFSKLNEDPTKTSRLYQITECDAVSNCKQPSEFDWTSVSSQNFQFKPNSTSVLGSHPELGLGGPDWSNVFGGSSYSSYPLNLIYSFGVGDFNGDGVADVLVHSDAVKELSPYSSTIPPLILRSHNVPESSGAPVIAAANGLQNLCPEGYGKCEYSRWTSIVQDINGDGFDDILIEGTINYNWPAPGMGPTGKYVNGLLISYSKGDGTFTNKQWLYPPVVENLPLNTVVIDITGDGLPDIVNYNFYTNALYVRKNLGGGNFGSRENAAPAIDLISLWRHQFSDATSSNIWYQLKFGDFNGDGLQDIYTCKQIAKDSKECVPMVLINENGVFAQPVKWGNNTVPRRSGSLGTSKDVLGDPTYRLEEHLADMNGDGITDLVKISFGNAIYVALSDGTQFLPYENWTANNKIIGFLQESMYGTNYTLGGGLLVDGQVTSFEGISIVDVNNDGCADIIGNGDTNSDELPDFQRVAKGIVVALSRCSYNNGVGFSTPKKWSASSDFQRSILGMGSPVPATLYDLDGKGGMDSYQGVNAFEDHKIVAVRSGIGNSQGLEIQYSGLTNPNVYKKSSAMDFMALESKTGALNKGVKYNPTSASEIVKRDALEIVANIVSRDGVGGSKQTNYSYEGYKRHRQGYGSLGFAKIQKIESAPSAPSIKTVDLYEQEFSNEYLLARNVKNTKKSVINSGVETLVAETNYNWKVRVFSDDLLGVRSPHYSVYLLEKQINNYELNGGGLVNTITELSYKGTQASSCPSISLSTPVNRTVRSADHIDDYGTAFNTEINHCDAFGSTSVRHENTNVLNDTSKWQIGLVKDPYVYYWTMNKDTNSLVDSKIRHSSFTFDDKGRVATEIKEPNASSDIRIEQAYSYNVFGAVSRIDEKVQDFDQDGIDYVSRSIIKRESYSASGKKIVETENAYGQISTQIFDEKFGVLQDLIDANGNTLSNSYDGFGRLHSTKESFGIVTSYDYRVCAQCFSFNLNASWYVQKKRTGLSATRAYYDGFGRSIGVREKSLTGGFNFQVNQFNSIGQIEKESMPYRNGNSIFNSEYRYDALGRLIQKTTPENAQQTLDYSLVNGKLKVLTKDTLGHESTKYYDSLGREKLLVDAMGTTAVYTHDAIGNIIQVDVKGAYGQQPVTHQIKYDLLGRKTQLIDPDTGLITYKYNAFGHLVSQTNALNETIRYTYDKLDRQISRIDPPSTTDPNVRVHQWLYDTKPNGIGSLSNVMGFDTQGKAFSEDYNYNELGQLTETNYVIAGESFNVKSYYDNFNRKVGMRYPSGLAIQYDYNSYGFKEKVSNVATQQLYWRALDDDAFGHLTNFSFGDGSFTSKSYNPQSALVNSIQVTKGADKIQDHVYGFDTDGNLRSREDKRALVKQFFCYDTLNRLTSSPTNSQCNDVIAGDYSTSQFAYDIHGNLLKKDGVADFVYGVNAGPHAVTHANGQDFVYDAAGRMRSGTGRLVEYSPFGKPTYMTRNGYQTQVVYGPLENRIRRLDIESGSLTTTTYVDKYYERIQSPTGTEHRHYIGDFGIYVTESSGSSYMVYQHLDHIGSIVAKTDDKSGSSSKFLANEPWGQRQEKTWNGQVYPTLSGAKLKETTYGTTRGFTGHEHLDGVGLIHMNGRVYDPTIGRFLSPDPWIQDPKNPQSFNRYSYVWNNPLRYTDPTGEFIPLVVWGVVEAVSAGAALYGSWETGQAIGRNGYAVYSGEKSAGEAAKEGAIEVGTNVALSATGLGVAKIANRAAPGFTSKVKTFVKEKVENIRDKSRESSKNLNAKSDGKKSEIDTKVDSEAPRQTNSVPQNVSEDIPKESKVYHRLGDSEENMSSIAESGELYGNPPKNFFQSDIPKVQAYEGPLPKGKQGFEFTTEAKPDAGHVPGKPTWSGNGHNADVKTVDDKAVIQCNVTLIVGCGESK